MSGPTDHMLTDYLAAEALATAEPELGDFGLDDEPGPGFLVYRLAQDFHALCCKCGREEAERELAEIIQFERKPR